jgi:hypothetical protein
VQAQGDKADPFTDMARQRFQEGVKLFDAKKFEEARAAFLQAYALKKHPAVLLNLAQSELKSGHFVDAARHFSQYLQENSALSQTDRKPAEQGLAEARLKTARIQIEVNVAGADVFVDDELVGKAPLRDVVDVGPGPHKVEARFAGYPNAAGQVSANVGQVVALALKLDRGGSSAAVVAPPTPPPTTGTAAPVPAPPATQDVTVPPSQPSPPTETPPDTAPVEVSTAGRTPFFTWVATDKVAWATGGAAVVGVGAGIIFSALASSAASNANYIAGQIKARASGDEDIGDRASNPCAEPVVVTKTDYRPACNQLKDNLDKRDVDRTVAILGWTVGVVGIGATAAAYFIRNKPKPTEPRVSFVPIVSPTMSGLAVGGTF